MDNWQGGNGRHEAVSLIFDMTSRMLMVPGGPVEGLLKTYGARGPIYIECSRAWAEDFCRKLGKSGAFQVKDGEVLEL